MVRPNMSRLFAVLAALFAAAPAARGDTLFRGRDVYEGLKESVDVVDAHLRFLQAQGARGEPFSYVNWTSRWAVGRMVLADGQQVAGNLSRTQFNLGFGFGALSRLSFFAGANLDLTGFTGPAWTPIENISNLAGGQSYLFGGFALADVQVTYASKQNFVDEDALNLDPWGNYLPAGEGPSFRPGTPWAISSPASDDAWLIDVLSIYENRTGAFLSVSWADVPITTTTVDESGRVQGGFGGTETRIVDVRAHLQPLRALPRQVVEIVGIPGLGLRRLDPAVAAAFDEAQRKREEASSLTEREEEEEGDAPYEIDFGTEDVLGGGLRWRVVQRVRPEPFFKRGEVGYVGDHPLGEGAVRLGLQALVHRVEETYDFAAESFALFSPTGARSGLAALSFGLAYSYNSPDTATFLPIPDAHVFGFQVIWGAPETARPLVPLVRAVEDRHGAFGGSP
jgi:hypothetical protein